MALTCRRKGEINLLGKRGVKNLIDKHTQWNEVVFFFPFKFRWSEIYGNENAQKTLLGHTNLTEMIDNVNISYVTPL